MRLTTHTRTRTRAHAHAHTHTHTKSNIVYFSMLISVTSCRTIRREDNTQQERKRERDPRGFTKRRMVEREREREKTGGGEENNDRNLLVHF